MGLVEINKKTERDELKIQAYMYMYGHPNTISKIFTYA